MAIIRSEITCSKVRAPFQYLDAVVNSVNLQAKANDAETQQGQSAAPRLVSLDAYRGLIMVSLAFTGFGLAKTAGNQLQHQPHSSFWQAVKYQFSHVEWVGCGYWDLIQPSFMFMVGVSMAFSYAKRRELGQSYRAMLKHAMWRSLVLIALGIFLISNGRSATNWSLMNVLTQIGLGYTFLFLLWGKSWKVQASAAGLILVGTWLLYALFPGTGIDASVGAPDVGVSQEFAQDHLSGVGKAWHKNANAGHAIDCWLLNWFPRRRPFQSGDHLAEPFAFNRGGYQTINFVPSLATMLFGLMCGELLRSSKSRQKKLAVLIGVGIAGLIVGQILHATGVCPIVKRIWTPSWAIFSAGWCCLILAALYALIDVAGARRWAIPVVVVGMNSIAIYCMSMLLKTWTANTLKTHLGDNVFQPSIPFHVGQKSYRFAGAIWEPTVQAVAVGLFFWLICFWMYRRKIFLRI